ncbi:hypothetical protein [Nocardioides kribbensis]|uniref:Mce-associated membrane protein n=1 Tax=Nocardioides kribbensis TaxID=305517 RepID=A0ABV1P0V2_9ACTN
MAVPPAPDVSGLTDDSRTDDPARTQPAPAAPSRASARFRFALLVVLVAVALASVASLVTLAATRADGGLGERLGSLVGSSDDSEQAQREEVMDAATQFVLRLNSYGPDDLDDSGQMPGYRASVSEVITPKFRTEFEQSVNLAEQTVAQADLERTCDVFASGVSSMDEDSAEVLVAGEFTNTYTQADDGEPFQDRPAQFRLVVTVLLVDGEWLVDDFVPATGDGVELPSGAAPGASTAPSPGQGGGSGRPSGGATP